METHKVKSIVAREKLINNILSFPEISTYLPDKGAADFFNGWGIGQLYLLHKDLKTSAEKLQAHL